VCRDRSLTRLAEQTSTTASDHPLRIVIQFRTLIPSGVEGPAVSCCPLLSWTRHSALARIVSMIFAMKFVATFCTGLFAGAALYITVVEHPARMECGTTLAATEFGPSYRRATVMQASLAIAGFLAAMVSFVFVSNYAWLLGGICIVAVVPFTLIVILPTNKKLLDPSLNRNSEAARQLLVQWGRLHAVRTVLSLAAFVLFLWTR
jgi:uncharacterized membrane protein